MGGKNNTFLTKYIKYSPCKRRQAVAKEQDNNPARVEKKPKRNKKAHSALKTRKQPKVCETNPHAPVESASNAISGVPGKVDSGRRLMRPKLRLSQRILDLYNRSSNAFAIARAFHLPWHVIQRFLRRALP